MSGRSMGLVLMLLAAIAGVFFLLGGPSALFGTGRGPDAGGVDGAPAELAPGAGAAAGDATSRPDETRLAVALRPERKGIGGLTLRVVRLVGETPLEGAVVEVSGTGYGGEAVVASLTTTAQGVASFPTLAAGGGYELRIEAKGEPVIVVPDVEVRAGRTKDLGDVIVGARGVLAGRVVDEKGKGVAGAEVGVYAAYESLVDMMGNMMEVFGSLGREPKALAKGVTDGAGRFALPDLASGPVAVRARAEGRRPAFVRTRMSPEGAAGGPLTIKIEGGEAVAGVVVDGAGAPIVGATVAILATRNGEDPGEFLYGRIFATTDPKGAFKAWVGRAEKKLRAVVDAQGFPATVTPEFAAGAKELRFVLLAGASVNVSVVASDDGAPVAGAQVAMMVADKDMDKPDGSGGFLFGVTDAAGKVSFLSPPGRIEMLLVSHREFAPSAGSPGREGRSGMGGSPLDGEIPKEIVSDKPATMTVKLARGITLVGKVLDPDGKPIAGATLRSFSFGLGGSPSTRSEADGAFRLTGLVVPTQGMGMPGSMVIVKAAGWVQAPKEMSVDSSKAVNGELSHDFVLAPASTISGRVVGPDGAPVAGAKVSALLGSLGGGMGFLFGESAAYTGTDGRYVLRDLEVSGGNPLVFMSGAPDDAAKKAPEGRVRVELEGFVPLTSAPFLVTQGAAIDAPELTLSRGQELAGIVREPSGRPAVGATVAWTAVRAPNDGSTDMNPFRRGDGPKTVTDEDGSYRLMGLPMGKIVVTISSVGFVGARETLDVGAGRLPPLDVSLKTGLTVKVRVTYSDGGPVVGATCVLSAPPTFVGKGASDASADDVPPVERQAALVDARGEATFDGIPADTSVSIGVYAEGYAPKTKNGPVTGETLVIVLKKRDPVAEARLKEVQKEIQEIFQKQATTKDDAAKQELQKRLMELFQEQQRLNADESADDEGTPASAVAPR